MKLVLAAPLYPPESGGPATYAKLLVEGLPAEGVEVVLVPFSSVRTLPKLVRHVAYYLRVHKELKNADAVLALDPVSTGLPAYAAARALGKPFFVKIVGDYAWEQGRQRFGVKDTLDAFLKKKSRHLLVRIVQYLQTHVAKGATTIIVPSRYLAGVITQWGVPKESISVVRNAVSVGALGVVPEIVAQLPRPWIVSASRLVPWKRMEGVMDAVVGTNASLIIAGDGPERGRLEQYAHSLSGLSTTFTGALSNPDLLAVIKSADLFVLNSEYEGLSHLLLETVALGTPVIATDAGGNTEVLEGIASARLVPVQDPGALREAIVSMLAHPPERSVPAPDSVGRMVQETATLLSKV